MSTQPFSSSEPHNKASMFHTNNTGNMHSLSCSLHPSRQTFSYTHTYDFLNREHFVQRTTLTFSTPSIRNRLQPCENCT